MMNGQNKMILGFIGFVLIQWIFFMYILRIIGEGSFV